MKRNLLILAALLSISSSIRSEYLWVPLSVDKVETYRVAENLIRVVRHNMELMPKIDLEMLSTPSVELVDAVSIHAITVDGEMLDFAESNGVFIEGVQAQDSTITIELDYYYADGGSDLITCLIAVKQDSFGKPRCRKQ